MKWTTQDGRQLEHCDMETDHILNVLGLVEKSINKHLYIEREPYRAALSRLRRIKRVMHEELARRKEVRNANP